MTGKSLAVLPVFLFWLKIHLFVEALCYVVKPLVIYKFIITITDINTRYKTFFSVLANNIV